MWRAPKDPYVLHRYPEVVNAPYSSNPNIAAQRGVHLALPVNLDLSARATREDFINVLGEIDKTVRRYGHSALKKFTLPASQAPHMLWYLAKHGVSGAHLFPGYAGAARGALELQWRTPECEPGT